MSSSIQGSSDNDRGKARKLDKQTRRSWTPQEETVLLAALKEVIANGWKSDNGFKQGYLLRLEDHLKKEFPSTDLKVMPHINSKVQTWKRNYHSLCLMTSRSGVGFNDNETYQIECNDDQWDSIVKKDTNAKTMRYKSWPMFEEWKEIFGKDRATGDAAEDVMDVVNDLVEEDNRGEFGKDSGDYQPCFDDICVDDDGVNSACDGKEGEAVNKSSGKDEQGDAISKTPGMGKKRKSSELGNAMVDLLGDISRATISSMESIASRMAYNNDVDQATKEAFALLESIPDISLEDQFKVGEIFADKPERMSLFKSLPADKKAKYVEHLLKK